VSVLVWSVLAASLVGSPHCAGMCGGFAWLAAPGPAPRLRPTILYHGARLAGYVVLGAVAGLLGAGLDRIGAFVGLGRVAAVVAGAVMLAWGASTVLVATGVRLPRVLRVPSGGPWSAALARVKGWPGDARAAALGLFTALLPCGWLWVFVAMAAATGGPLAGAALMLVFWAGTLPAFALLGVIMQRAAGPLRRHLPLVTGAALIVVGAVTMLGRGLGAHQHATTAATTTHDGHRAP
jgi:sulfite exporter TauE/SafE